MLRRLRGVAHHPDDGVPAGHRERVGGLVVFDESDQLMQLVEVEAGEELVVGQHGRGQHIGHAVMVRPARQLAQSDG